MKAMRIVAAVLSEHEEAYGVANPQEPIPFVDYAWSYEHEVYALVDWMIDEGFVKDHLEALEAYNGGPWNWREDKDATAGSDLEITVTP